MRGVNRRTDRRILPRFRIQSEILTDFQILQLQRIAYLSIFWARILDFACNSNFLFIFGPGFQIQGESGRADLVNNS